ncbi:MAG TPA: sigma-70 family RNA polymerase sigma factor [Urbifossiella sp.]|nr:sigma-70 family RNA polymerase sigma factor [Urbifossiella sp.]
MESVAPLTAADRLRVALLYHFTRLQLPAIAIAEPRFRDHLARTFAIFLPKSPTATWSSYLEGLYALDWTVCIGCLEGLNQAWETLFNARTGRSDCLLVDALRARAARLYPRDDEKQDTAVTEFWSNLIVPESEETLPILARYDGQRPLAPWLIRVFQNWHLSKLRQHHGVTALPDDDIAMPLDSGPKGNGAGRWHESFVMAARDWLGGIDDEERLLLGLRWRYRLSQRDAASLLGLHEGSISRRTDKLRDRALEQIGHRLIGEGWSGDDLEGFVLTELGSLLTDDPRLSADQLSRLLAARGKGLPVESAQ